MSLGLWLSRQHFTRVLASIGSLSFFKSLFSILQPCMCFFPRQQSSLGLATLQMGCVWIVWCILLGSLHHGYQFPRVAGARPKARNHVEMAGLSHVVTVQLGHSDDAVQMVPQWWSIRDRGTFWNLCFFLMLVDTIYGLYMSWATFFGASFWLKKELLPWQEIFSRGSENTMNPCSHLGIETSQVLDKFGPRSVDMVPWSKAIACIRC